ncbi:hypothetical protein [Mammaliicoccus sciuri]|uniref:hypothetical protein n=1 Tax=Mammaliicoccus sciuri TaxID=1296 RepID=UPI003CEDCD27
MDCIINKLFERHETFSILESTDGEIIVTIPIYGFGEIEIIKNDNYKVNIPSMKPYTPPETKTFQKEIEVMSYLFKED